MTEYDQHFDRILNFIGTYTDLINCHLVDFITQELWNNCLPVALRLELEEYKMDLDNWTPAGNSPELENFITSAKSLSLESLSLVKNIRDVPEIFPNQWFINIPPVKDKCKNTKMEFTKDKKVHEVETLGNIVASLAVSSCSLVIDAGAGKAYLSTYLAERYKIPVLAMDSSTLCHRGAMRRQEKLEKGQRKQPYSLVRYVVQEINEETNFPQIVTHNFCEWNLNKNLILTGLHTCGGLAHSIIRAFLRTKDISCLCIVPCCYHLTNETFGDTYKFSKNARMLAQQSVERSIKKKEISPLLFYRAVLQVVLHSLGRYDVRVGRGGPVSDFSSYANWAMLKIGIEAEKIPSTNDLEKIYRSYAHLKNKFDIFQMLRIHAGPVLEAAITLDRVVFLIKSKQSSKVTILRLFDPVLSPRRYAIVAIK